MGSATNAATGRRRASLRALIAISGTHFGASYHLAYGQGRHQVRRSGVLLIGVPVALFLTVSAVTIASLSGGVDIANEVTSFLLVVVFTTTTWHYVKQVYGVARVGASLADLRLDPLTTHVLRYGLYPIWLLEAIKIWSGRSGGRFEETRIGYNVLPDFLVSALAWITYGSIAVIAMVFIRLSLRSGRVPATMWTPYVAGFLWIPFQPSYASVVLVFGALHGLQYLACAHRAEVAWGKERSAGRPNLWWSSAFGGALATGLLLVYWLPRFLTDATQTTSLGAIPAALLFIFFNLHHYAVDASIWRFGGQHIGRITGSR